MNLDSQTGQKPSILVISTSSFFDLDKLGSAIALAKLLKAKHQAKVDLYFGLPTVPKELAHVVPPSGVNLLEELSKDYFTLSIDRNDAKISEVKWEETADKIKILIFTEKGSVDTKTFTTQAGSPHYDHLYSVGIKDEQRLRQVLGEFAGLVDSAQTHSIDINAGNANFAQQNYIYPDCASFAEAILEFCKQQELIIDGSTATQLLSLLYWKTGSFQNKYTRPEVFSSAKQLLELGAAHKNAVAKIMASLTFSEVKARQEIYNNLTITKEKYVFSRVSKEVAKSLQVTNPIYPFKNPLANMRDIKASFVFIPVHEAKTLVLASSSEGGTNLKNLFKDYGFVGDSAQSEFSLDADPNSAEAKVKQILAISPS